MQSIIRNIAAIIICIIFLVAAFAVSVALFPLVLFTPLMDNNAFNYYK